MNDVTKWKEEKTWTLKEDDKEITNEGEIAETFNKFFVPKIEQARSKTQP